LSLHCSTRLYDRRVSEATTAGVVLAAGRGSRFGGNKLLADLDGRPLLQHVLDLAAEVELGPVVVVLGGEAARIEQSIAWRGETRVRNPAPERGLSSSLQLGLDELERIKPDCRRAAVLLGDQPRLAAEQLRILLDQPPDEAQPIIVPRYADGRPGNPVLLERGAWPLAATLEGDRGMSQLFAGRPELIRMVDVSGTNPDVDTRGDLSSIG
jgi:CTP:molybdopterin cytidylyltransferase MocA